jgi:hypothetical protein
MKKCTDAMLGIPSMALITGAWSMVCVAATVEDGDS